MVDQQRAFHELATIIAGENAFASKIKMHALKAFAVYDALVGWVVRAHFFAFSPPAQWQHTALSEQLGRRKDRWQLPKASCGFALFPLRLQAELDQAADGFGAGWLVSL